MNTLRGTVSFEFLLENRWTTECKMSCWPSAVCILTTLGNGWALTPIYIVTASLFSQVHLRLLSHCYWEINVRKCQWTCPPSHSLQTTWQMAMCETGLVVCSIGFPQGTDVSVQTVSTMPADGIHRNALWSGWNLDVLVIAVLFLLKSTDLCLSRDRMGKKNTWANEHFLALSCGECSVLCGSL